MLRSYPCRNGYKSLASTAFVPALQLIFILAGTLGLLYPIGEQFFRRGGRAVEGARLESVYTLIAYRGFESRPLRQILKGTACPFYNL